MQLTVVFLVSILSWAVEILAAFPQEHDEDLNVKNERLKPRVQNFVGGDDASVLPFSSSSLLSAGVRAQPAPFALASNRDLREEADQLLQQQTQPRAESDKYSLRDGFGALSSSSEVNAAAATPSLASQSLQQRDQLPAPGNAVGTPAGKDTTSKTTVDRDEKFLAQGFLDRVSPLLYNYSAASLVAPSSLFSEGPRFEDKNNRNEGGVQYNDSLLGRRRRLMSKLAKSARGRNKGNKGGKNGDASSGSSGGDGENEETEQADSMQAEVEVTNGNLDGSQKTHFFQSASQLMASEQGEGGLPPRWKLSARKSLGSEVHLFHDVCIEKHPKPWVEVKAGSCPHRPDKAFNINRRIVVYNSPRGNTEEKAFTVGGHGNRKNTWEVVHRSNPPPASHKWADYPAVFATTSCSGNLHHFLVDQFSRTYTVMKLLNRTSALPPGRAGGDPRAFHAKKVALLYRDDVHSFCRDTGCHDPTKFEHLLFTLPLVSHRAYFTDDQHLNVCFRDAVMGAHRLGTSDREIGEFIVRGLGLDNRQKGSDSGGREGGEVGHQSGECPTDADRTVLVLQRDSRKLLNADEIANWAASSSPPGLHARIVTFEGMAVLEQMQAVRCCKLLIAVMGAGQQWVSFMRRGSVLLSVGWKNWRADYYQKYAKEAGVQFLSAQTSLVYPNYKHPTVVKFFGADKLKTDSFRASIKDHKQVAKYSDVKLNKGEVERALKTAFKG